MAMLTNIGLTRSAPRRRGVVSVNVNANLDPSERGLIPTRHPEMRRKLVVSDA